MLNQEQLDRLTKEQLQEYIECSPEQKEQFEYFYGFTFCSDSITKVTNKEIELYQQVTDTIPLKNVAQVLNFIPHKGQQPIFYTFDVHKEIINNMVMVLGRRAQPLDSVIKSPTGDITFKDVKVNDVIFDPDGGLQTVKAVHDIYDGEVYEVQVGNKTCKVDSEHLFTVIDKHGKERVLDIKHILQYYKRVRKNSHRLTDGKDTTTELTYKIKNPSPVMYPEAELPIDPYLLGLLLGDGSLVNSTRLGMRDKECIIRGMHNQGVTSNIYEAKKGYYSVNLGMLNSTLKDLGLFGTRSNTKFIPSMYLTASVEQRLELLRGLMDTDGCVVQNRNKTAAEFITVSPELSKGVEELVYSLGGDCTISTKLPTYKHNGVTKQGKLAYRHYIRSKLNPFWVPRKATKFKEQEVLFNYIKDIRKIPDTKVRCISVSAPSECYLTDNYIRTHNTGKSASTSVIAVRELLVPYSSTILLTPTFNNARVIFNDVLKHVQALGLEIKSINKGAFRFELENGARFSANSASNIESALGTANSLLIVDESQSVPNLDHIMKQMLVPTLLDYGSRSSGILYGRQIYLGTPRGVDNQLYDLFINEEQFTNWKSFSAPSTTNPILPQSYFDSMRLELGDMLFEQEILAKFIGTDDNVFYALSEENLYKTGAKVFNSSTDFVVGIDIGFRDSTAAIFAYRDARGYYYIDKCYSESQKATSFHVNQLKALDSSMLGTLDMRYMDPAAAQSICDYTQDYDYLVHPAKNDVQASIKYINQLLTPTGANKEPKLYINSELTELIRQLKRVRWKDKTSKTSKDPFVSDNKGTHWDLISAVRYGVYSDLHNVSAGCIIQS